MSKTLLVVGLGNPGEEYAYTRHNVGFRVVDYWWQKAANSKPDTVSPFTFQKKHQALLATVRQSTKKILIAKPQTFMNNSGLSVKLLVDYYQLALDDLLIIHDDLSFSVGDFKINCCRGAAGHNGVRSLIEHLGSQDFCRLRVGIKPVKSFPDSLTQPLREMVLGKFSLAEEKILEETFSQLARVIDFWAQTNSCNLLQNKFNRK